MGHYLNTLYPDSRSVSYSLGTWMKGRKGASSPARNLSLYPATFLFLLVSRPPRHFSSLLLPFPFRATRRERKNPDRPSSLPRYSSAFSTRVFPPLFLIDRSAGTRESPRKSLSDHFHVCWITRFDPKVGSFDLRLPKCRW